MALVYIGLGSNQGHPRQQIKKARQALAALPQSHLLADSGLFGSPAMTLPGDDQPQPDYLNAVIKLETNLLPHDLLASLQAIETAQGRERSRRWGPRTLDLDILVYDDLQLSDERLSIPHPGIAERDFVLYPLQAIDAELVIAGLGPLSRLITGQVGGQVEYLGPIDE
jgi:2-amino-4-hydroxy-6-hydroxymethyldihydropteridine diphosphokinase